MSFSPIKYSGLRVWTSCLLLAMLALLAVAAPARAAFGVKGFDLTFTNANGSTLTEAGAHPFAVRNILEFNSTEYPGHGEVPDELVKDVHVGLPPGLVGDPGAVPRCSGADFIHFNQATKIPDCSNGAAVGVIQLGLLYQLGEEDYITAPVYNLVPPPGVIEKLGFIALGVPVTMNFTLNQSPPYNVIVTLKDIPQPLPVFSSELAVWGDPASPEHDWDRGSCIEDWPNPVDTIQTTGESCPANTPEAGFVTLPRACTGPLSTSFAVDSWEDPGAVVEGSVLSHGASGLSQPEGLDGCYKLGFAPSIVAKATTRAAESPTGLEFGINVNNEGLVSPNGLAQSDIRKAVVTLPEGMTANPSLAEGLVGCTEADVARETAESNPGEGCPEASKMGTAEVQTPLLEEPLDGTLYIAQPYENQFKSLLAAYFVLKSAKLGIIIRQPAEIVPNPVTGQLVTIVEEIPQLPFSHFTLHFREGARSPLVSPPSCGEYDATAELTPWSGGAPTTTTSAFTIISGTNEGPCPAGGVPPFKPTLVAGTENNAAGTYSSLYLHIERKDEEQEITGFSTQLPPGVTGNLTGIPFCGQPEIEQGRQQTGAEAEANPTCPAASQIGTTISEAGVGSVLVQTPGKLYLAGPFEGAPFSVVDITSAKVGPFDLGTVVVHLPLRIDPETAQVSIPSGPADQIPHIIKGIIIHLRAIRVYINRPDFMINPTSCERMHVGATVIGAGANVVSAADDVPAAVSDSFQAADCTSLTFRPAFKASTSKKTSRANGASLHVTLTYPKESIGKAANIGSVKVDLPKALPSRLSTLQKACTSQVFEANPAACPEASQVGMAKAITPILPVPLIGPAYFVSHGGAKFPELIIVLQGYGVTIELHGETFISKKGITSSTFKTVPDQPVTSFELTLPEGRHSALAANGDLCKQKLAMPTTMIGQNGIELHQTTTIKVEGCPNTLTIRSHKVKRRTLTLKVYAPTPGTLKVSGKGLKTQTEHLAFQTTTTLKIPKTKPGKLKTRVRVTFTPSKDKTRKRQTQTLPVTFKR